MTFGAIKTLGRLAYDGGSNPLTVVLLRLCTFVFVIGLLAQMILQNQLLDAFHVVRMVGQRMERVGYADVARLVLSSGNGR